MTVPLHHVDAFTDHAFGGNPAAVCLLQRAPADPWMGAVAAEINLSETAFVWPIHPGRSRFGLRWWTPLVEVPLCGHATLAAAHVLRREGWVSPSESISFETRSGTLSTRPDGDLLELDFPAYEARPLTTEETAPLTAVLGRPYEEAVGYGPKLLLRLPDEAAVLAAQPDLTALVGLPFEGLLLTAARGGDREPGYVLRYFAPAVGIDEDPVTGSAQCAAGPYWHDRSGHREFAVEQLSARRGHLRVRVDTGGRIQIAGRSVTVSRGRLDLQPVDAPRPGDDPSGDVAPPAAQR